MDYYFNADPEGLGLGCGMRCIGCKRDRGKEFALARRDAAPLREPGRYELMEAPATAAQFLLRSNCLWERPPETMLIIERAPLGGRPPHGAQGGSGIFPTRERIVVSPAGRGCSSSTRPGAPRSH